MQSRDDARRMPQQELAGLGQRDTAGAAGTLHELLADDPFECLDLLADRGLRIAELLRGATERAFFRHRLQSGEVADLDAEPSIRPHDRHE